MAPLIPLSAPATAAFLAQHHYLGSLPRGTSYRYGVQRGRRLLGVVCFGVGASQAARAVPWGPAQAGRVLELTRLCLAPTPDRPPASQVIRQALRTLDAAAPGRYWGVISFADPAAPGHHLGTVYRAAGGLFYGDGGARAGDRDPQGRIHTRRHGPTLPAGWSRVRLTPKRRYLFLLGRPAQQRLHRRQLQVQAVAFQPALPWVWTLLAALARARGGRPALRELSVMLSRCGIPAERGRLPGWGTAPDRSRTDPWIGTQLTLYRALAQLAAEGYLSWRTC